ncbi:ABC transporter ATP-binding protein [Vibrio coralliilyticus]|uniref:ABC transporter ATP-binding protein n=1 Tax=Vibrio coralliilyticus TaxID=190893 RepID=UPI000BAAED18|nr:ABC transporter ATP-binding protein [Vibrio coralliilyticus]NOI29198.1 ABC transporter ATP-binding protein [Vibrio coralliilyticus]NOI47889.1 ABC transporter ATP-binding protein [Vibrio coralliilyticus]NOI56702.1 ABC transporter ATP-binding protein [Vibrio coralliilyticus]PAT68267.1 ABC transporter [Vibrio coralliilyticus]
MSCALSINNLTCKYDEQTTVLESLSLEVEHGEIVCLLGASGCGKTTLLKSIAGLLPLSSGSMSLNCMTIDDGKHWLPPEQRNIGMIFQDYALFPHLTVEENVAFGLKALANGDRKAKVAEMLELVHLTGFEERYPHQLSGGQQQRVAIARSLAYKPDLLLLDEPFSNIDTQVRHELIAEIRKIFKKHGVTAIFVTHSREEAFAFADKMAVMNHGVIEQYGTASELYYQPSSKFVADFLGGGSYLIAKRVSESEFETELGLVEAQAQQEIQLQAECELLLRPQHVQISATEESSVTVLEQQFMGDHCRYVIDASGSRLLASSAEPLSIGQPVSVKVETQGVLAF